MARLVVLQRMIPIRAERSGKHRDIAEHRLKRLVQDVRHLVLEVLRRYKRVKKAKPPLAFACLNFSSCACYVRVRVECLPEIIQRLGSWLRSYVQKDADIRVQCSAKGVEEPSVRVQLLQVLLLEAENHLAGYDAFLCALELQVSVEGDLGCVLVDVCCDLFLVD